MPTYRKKNKLSKHKKRIKTSKKYKHVSSKKKVGMSKKQYIKHSKRRNKRRNKKSRTMKGGAHGLKPVPFVPDGSPYDIAANDNMLSKGYYYSLSPDFHGSRNILSQSGGGLIPRDLVDLGRNILAGAKSTYTGYVGDVLPTNNNPNASYQPALEKGAHLDYSSPNMNDILTKADKIAASVE